jgi:phosphoglycerate dehydrogenase-like enzyme
VKILFTTERSHLRDLYFPPAILESLEHLGDVTYHDGPGPLSAAQLAELVPGVDVCLTHWSCPRFGPEVVARADRLRLIAHAGGSVGDLVSREVFDAGIVVTSASAPMSAHVAEGVLTYILADLHRVAERSRLMREGGWLEAESRSTRSLSGLTVGLVGLGLVGCRLIELLVPFGARVLVYDPYVDESEVVRLGAESARMPDLLGSADVVSLHASLTHETRGMLDRAMLARIRDGALLVNTARAGLVDQDAMIAELATGRIRAVLDVFDEEPLAPGSPLRSLSAATLMPHSAGSSSGADLAATAVEEIARFSASLPPIHPVSFERYRLMTAENPET